jgi:hypothetical protein
MNRVRVRIDRLRLPAGTPLDREDLQRRVALELAELLRRAPPPERRGGAEARLRAGRVTIAAPGSAAAVAHAVARRIHAQLRFGEAGG